MAKPDYSNEFRDQALSKVRQRGTRTVEDVARYLNMPVGTLRKWFARSNRQTSAPAVSTKLPDELPAQSWSPAERLLALQETHNLAGSALHTWCREKGLFEHQLKAWRDAFCSAGVPVSRESRLAVRELQNRNEGLQRELRRKNRALAEAAASAGAAKKVPGAVGGRGEMTFLVQRQTLLGFIDEAWQAGARLAAACAQIGLSARTVQRWERPDVADGGDRRASDKRAVTIASNRLSAAERAAALALLNSDAFKDLRRARSCHALLIRATTWPANRHCIDCCARSAN